MRSIAIVIEGLGGGGAQHVVSTLANTWHKNGRTISLITFSGPEGDRFKVDPGIQRTVIGGMGEAGSLFRGILSNVRRVIRLRRAIQATQAEVVFGLVGTTNILTVLASCGLGKRVIISERNDPSRQSLGTVWDMLRRLTYRYADCVVANSRGAEAALQAYVPGEKLRWLPNPLRSFEPAENRATESTLILAMGRLHPQKGFDILLQAFSFLQRSRQEWTLAIVGEGDERRNLENLAMQLGIVGRVRFPGYTDKPAGWYEAAAVFVQPSRFEGLPNTVLEAMSCGLSCIVTDAQHGILEFLKDGESGIVVPSESSDALAAALANLMDNKSLRETLGRNARLSVASCEAGKVTQQWSALVDAL